jgi:hypoxanthine phosphoribosyltransferase
MHEYKQLTWPQIEKDVTELAAQFTNPFDVIIGVGRGGLIPAVLLSHRLNIRSIFNFSVQTYNNSNESLEEDVNQELDHHFIEKYSKKKILVVDDLSDKGKTLHYINKYLEEHKLEATFATLYIKVSTTFVPNYYIRSYDDHQWLIFPWEKK